MEVCISCRKSVEDEKHWVSRGDNKGKCKILVRREARQRWRQGNPEKKKAYNKRWWAANKEKSKQYNEKKREYKQHWFQENKERLRPERQAYRDANRGQTREAQRRYKARKRDAVMPSSRLELSAVQALYWIAGVLSNSCDESFHIDHIIPLSRGGSHTFENLQILSAEENLRKGSKLPEELEFCRR
jgi:5-methylcytosine-specific restriction endonuclease McrA